MNKVQAKFMDDIFLGSVVNLNSELEKQLLYNLHPFTSEQVTF